MKTHHYTGLGFAVESNVPLSLLEGKAVSAPKDGQFITQRLSVTCKIADGRSSSEEASPSIGFRRFDNSAELCLPGIIEARVTSAGSNQYSICCRASPSDTNFFCIRYLFSEVLRIAGVSRILGSVAHIAGRNIVFLGSPGAGKTSAVCAVRGLGGAVVGDEVLRWASDDCGVSISGGFSALLCWQDIRKCWSLGRLGSEIRGNAKRYLAPLVSQVPQVKGVSDIVSISVGNQKGMVVNPVMGLSKLLTVSGLVDCPKEFFSVCQEAAFWHVMRPRTVSSDMRTDWEDILKSIVASPSCSNTRLV